MMVDARLIYRSIDLTLLFVIGLFVVSSPGCQPHRPSQELRTASATPTLPSESAPAAESPSSNEPALEPSPIPQAEAPSPLAERPLPGVEASSSPSATPIVTIGQLGAASVNTEGKGSNPGTPSQAPSELPLQNSCFEAYSSYLTKLVNESVRNTDKIDAANEVLSFFKALYDTESDSPLRIREFERLLNELRKIDPNLDAEALATRLETGFEKMHFCKDPVPLLLPEIENALKLELKKIIPKPTPNGNSQGGKKEDPKKEDKKSWKERRDEAKQARKNKKQNKS